MGCSNAPIQGKPRSQEDIFMGRHEGITVIPLAIECCTNVLDLQKLQKLVSEKVDWYLDELVDAMKRKTGKHVSVSTLWRSLNYCGITWKKVYNDIFLCMHLILILCMILIYNLTLASQSCKRTERAPAQCIHC